MHSQAKSKRLSMLSASSHRHKVSTSPLAMPSKNKDKAVCDQESYFASLYLIFFAFRFSFDFRIFDIVPPVVLDSCNMSSSTLIFKPHFPVPSPTHIQKEESPYTQSLINSLLLLPHIEGGFYAETDRATDTVPSPFPPPSSTSTKAKDLAPQRPGFDPAVRNTSTTIFYLLTPSGPQGGFHRNLGRTVHTLHRGRGRYVIIHADEGGRRG